MFTMQDYIYEEKEVLSTILKKNDFSTREHMKKTVNLLILATGSSYNACLAAKPALESYGDLTVDIQEPFYFFPLWKTFSFNRYCDCCVTKREKCFYC